MTPYRARVPSVKRRLSNHRAEAQPSKGVLALLISARPLPFVVGSGEQIRFFAPVPHSLIQLKVDESRNCTRTPFAAPHLIGCCVHVHNVRVAIRTHTMESGVTYASRSTGKRERESSRPPPIDRGRSPAKSPGCPRPLTAERANASAKS